MILSASKSLKVIHVLGDLIILNITLISAYVIYLNSLNHLLLDHTYKNFFIGVNLAWIVAVNFSKTNEMSQVLRLERIIGLAINTVFIHLLLVSVYFVAFKAYYLSRFHLLITYSGFIIGLLVWRIIFVKILIFLRAKSGNLIKVAIIGSGEVGRNLGHFFLSDEAWGYQFLGYFDDEYPVKTESDIIGSVDDAFKYIKRQEINEIYCCLPDYAGEKVNRVIEACDDNVVRFRAVPDFTRYIRRRVVLETMGRIPIVHIRQEPLQSLKSRIKKRIFDLLVSTFVIVFILSWLYPLIGILIKFASNGPILFKQLRTGKENENFMCLKFRSMHVNDKSNQVQATKNDVRIHRFGNFLRKSSIDELPQFLNVFLGTMSVAGPRPHMVSHTVAYSGVINKYMVRHFIKPGITGWAQIKGYRGETENSDLMEKRIEHDLWYIENWSLLLDMKIVYKTIINAIKGEENAF